MASISFDKADTLLKTILAFSIKSFSRVIDWKDDATREVDILSRGILTLDNESRMLTTNLDGAKQQPALKRLFSREVGSLRRELSEIQQKKIECQKYIEQLQAFMSEIPTNPDEQKSFLKELRNELKSLRAKKKETNLAMREIRTAARQSSADLSGSLIGAFGGSKFRGGVRRSITYEREKNLSPHEQAKKQIEYEILSTERLIIWIESLE